MADVELRLFSAAAQESGSPAVMVAIGKAVKEVRKFIQGCGWIGLGEGSRAIVDKGIPNIRKSSQAFSMTIEKKY